MKFLERFWLGCGHCRGPDGCPVMENIESESGETRITAGGPGLVGAVILVFLVPLATAIGGAYLAGRWWAGPSQVLLGLCQVTGAVVGFFAGVGVAKLVFWTCRRFSSADGGIG